MEYLIFSDPRFHRKVTAWDVVCSGLFDSIGLYVEPTSVQTAAVLQWIDKLGRDLGCHKPKNQGLGLRV